MSAFALRATTGALYSVFRKHKEVFPNHPNEGKRVPRRAAEGLNRRKHLAIFSVAY